MGTMLVRLLFPLTVALGCAAPGAARHYVVDGAQSNISAKVSILAISSMTAHFPDIAGDAELDPQRMDSMRIAVTLDARSLTVSDDSWRDELVGEDFFDVAKYPTLCFSGGRLTMTGERTAQLVGALTARGVTRPITLDVTFERPPSQVADAEPLSISASGQIDREAFGMTAYQIAVGRTVTIKIQTVLTPTG